MVVRGRRHPGRYRSAIWLPRRRARSGGGASRTSPARRGGSGHSSPVHRQEISLARDRDINVNRMPRRDDERPGSAAGPERGQRPPRRPRSTRGGSYWVKSARNARKPFGPAGSSKQTNKQSSRSRFSATPSSAATHFTAIRAAAVASARLTLPPRASNDRGDEAVNERHLPHARECYLCDSESQKPACLISRRLSSAIVVSAAAERESPRSRNAQASRGRKCASKGIAGFACQQRPQAPATSAPLRPFVSPRHESRRHYAAFTDRRPLGTPADDAKQAAASSRKPKRMANQESDIAGL
jgi:hypothetical protein